MATYAFQDLQMHFKPEPLKVASDRTRDVPYAGRGYLAGESPDGLTTIEGVPTDAELRVLYRPATGAVGDGVIVQRLSSAPDGTWTAWGLNPDLRYDVIARKAGQNDVIMSDVAPVPYDHVTILGDWTASPLNQLQGSVNVYGGIPPYALSVTAGAPPTGIMFGMMRHEVQPAHRATAGGEFTWELTVVASNGASASRTFTVDGFTASFTALLIGFSPYIYYKLDEEAQGTVFDYSGNARHGTHPSYFAGYTLRQSPIFTGGSQYSLAVAGSYQAIQPASIATKTAGQNKWSFLVQFKTSASGLQHLMSADSTPRQWQFRLSGGSIELVTFDPTFAEITVFAGTLNDGAPHMAVIVFDDSLTAGQGMVKVYIDGELFGVSTTTRRLIPSSAIPLGIGIRSSGYNGENFQGELSDAAVFDRALTAGEVAALWSARESQ